MSCQWSHKRARDPGMGTWALTCADAEFLSSITEFYAGSTMSRSLPLILALLTVICQNIFVASSHSPPTCNTEPYGTPDSYDCFNLLLGFANGHDAQLRVFDEEQLRADESGAWPGIVNPFKTSVVQVPRFWSRSMLALDVLHLAQASREGCLILESSR